MNALANSLARIWSANGRIPCLTGQGISGRGDSGIEFSSLVRRSLQEFSALVRRISPTVLLLAFNIFR